MTRKAQDVPALQLKEGLPLVFVDDGSSNIKIEYAGKRSQIKSFVVRKKQDGLMSSDSHYITNGTDYTVLESKTRDCINTTGEQYQLGDANRVLIHHAMKKAGVKGEVYLYCTIPASSYYHKGERNEAIIHKKIASMLTEVSNSDVTIKEVRVFPEGVIASFANGISDQVLGCVDIGYYTTDLSQFNGTSLDDSASINSGVSEIHEYFRKYLIKNLEANRGNALLKADIDEALETLNNTNNNNRLPMIFDNMKFGNLPPLMFETPKQAAIAKWFSSIKKDSDFERIAGQSDKVIFVGGGAHLITLDGMSSKFTKASDPVFGNIDGMVKIG